MTANQMMMKKFPSEQEMKNQEAILRVPQHRLGETAAAMALASWANRWNPAMAPKLSQARGKRGGGR